MKHTTSKHFFNREVGRGHLTHYKYCLKKTIVSEHFKIQNKVKLGFLIHDLITTEVIIYNKKDHDFN